LIKTLLKWCISPPPVGLCRLSNKNTAVPIDASIMETAAFFFAQPYGWVAVGREI